MRGGGFTKRRAPKSACGSAASARPPVIDGVSCAEVCTAVVAETAGGLVSVRQWARHDSRAKEQLCTACKNAGLDCRRRESSAVDTYGGIRDRRAAFQQGLMKPVAACPTKKSNTRLVLGVHLSRHRRRSSERVRTLGRHVMGRQPLNDTNGSQATRGRSWQKQATAVWWHSVGATAVVYVGRRTSTTANTSR